MKTPDVVFAGHTYRDCIRRFGHADTVTVGGALSYGAVAAARIGARVTVVTKLAPADDSLLSGIRDAGVRCVVIPAPSTSEFEVIYPSSDMEHRSIFQRASAPAFAIGDIPVDLRSGVVHLAGNAQGEFDLTFLRALRSTASRLSLDMQAFVRQPDPVTQTIRMRDVADKQQIVACLDAVKLDTLESEILTGERQTEAAARAIARWGCGEVIVTRSDGVVGCFDGRTVVAPFTNRGSGGRNGRGDTTFAAYLVRRRTHPPDDALRFAAALASIKLEKPGPFDGTLADVLARMQQPA